MQIIVLCFNMVGVLLAVGYNKRIQLYAGLTQASLSAPDGLPQVGMIGPLDSLDNEAVELERGKLNSENEANRQDPDSSTVQAVMTKERE